MRGMHGCNVCKWVESGQKPKTRMMAPAKCNCIPEKDKDPQFLQKTFSAMNKEKAKETEGLMDSTLMIAGIGNEFVNKEFVNKEMEALKEFEAPDVEPTHRMTKTGNGREMKPEPIEIHVDKLDASYSDLKAEIGDTVKFDLAPPAKKRRGRPPKAKA